MTHNTLQQRKMARILFDEFHNESWSIDLPTAQRMQPNHPADSSYAVAASELARRDFLLVRNLRSPLTAETLRPADVLVIAHPSDTKWERTTNAESGSPLFDPAEIEAIQQFVYGGGGLVVMGETEQDKYGNNINALLQAFGIQVENATLTDHAHCHTNVPSWVLADGAAAAKARDYTFNLAEGITQACFLRAGVLGVQGEARVVLRAHASASTPTAPLIAATLYGAGRVVVLADSDLFGDDDFGHFDHQALWLNMMYWVAQPVFGKTAQQANAASAHPSTQWLALKEATNTLRAMQKADGSLKDEAVRADATQLVQQMQMAIVDLIPQFGHEQAYLQAAVADLQTWVDGGFARPDFGKSLALFRPELNRQDNIEHIVVFPLYTPNGSPDTRFEALHIRTPWPDWLATLERTQFDNGKFVPVHFVDCTDGYKSECAVLFPETVALTGKPSNNFGGIFCDREAERYQRVVSAACRLMQVNLPPQAAAFLQSSDLIRDTFALWDLIHDRWHSHGELPFDPFMIRQRLPYWMYSLEELRVDLQTFGSTSQLEQQGFPFARYVKFGILFDRIFRFPITGNRVRNYDGLGGQLLFACLHKKGYVAWRDNALLIDWAHLDEGIAGLREQIEQLYRAGIDMTKVQYWLAAHDLVSEWVKPNLGSKWAKDTRVLSDESQPKDWINRVLDDEFPLSLFYLQLQKKLAALPQFPTSAHP